MARMHVLAAQISVLAVHLMVSDAANCPSDVQSKMIETPSYLACKSANSNLDLTRRPNDKSSLAPAAFCSAESCAEMYDTLVGLGGAMCMQLYDAGNYKLFKTDEASSCFGKYGALPGAAVPSPTTAPPIVATSGPVVTTVPPAATPTPTTKSPSTIASTPQTPNSPDENSKTPSPSSTGATGTTSTGAADSANDDASSLITDKPNSLSSSSTPSSAKTKESTSTSKKTSFVGSVDHGDATNQTSKEDKSDRTANGVNSSKGGENEEENLLSSTAAQAEISQSAVTGADANKTMRGSDRQKSNSHAGDDLDTEDRPGTSSASVWAATGGAGGGTVLIGFIVFLIRRRDKNASSDKAIGMFNENPYIPTLASSRSRHSGADNVAMLGASRVGVSFMATSTRSGFWEEDFISAVRVPYEKISFDALISRGGFGEVYRGDYRGQSVAIKTLLPERRKDMRQIEKFLMEMKLMSSLEHENIVQFVGVAWDSLNELCVLSEYMHRGDLRTLLSQYELDQVSHPRGFNAEKIKIALHVANGLTYMHSLQPTVLHRDLKSRNILLDESLNAKLTDFGVSRERVDSTMTAGVGTTLWMAPEIVMGERYDEKADVFSLGVVFSELDTHTLPYTHILEPGTRRKLPDAILVQMVAFGRISVEFSDRDDTGMAALGRRCVSLMPADRPSAAEVQHELHQLWRSVTTSV